MLHDNNLYEDKFIFQITPVRNLQVFIPLTFNIFRKVCFNTQALKGNRSLPGLRNLPKGREIWWELKK